MEKEALLVLPDMMYHICFMVVMLRINMCKGSSYLRNNQ